MGFDVTVRAQIPEGLTHLDFDVAQVRKGLRAMAAGLRPEARRELSKKQISKPGEAPGRRTGNLARSIQVSASRARQERENRTAWARLEFGSKVTAKNGAYYPAPLIHGRRYGTLQPRLNVLPTVQARHRQEFESRLEDLLTDAIKGWGE